MTRLTAVPAVALGALLILTGCRAYYFDERSDPISEADVVGLWVAESEDGETATLEFSADGDVVVTGVPVDTSSDMTDVDWSGERITEDGRWSIEETDTRTWHVDTVLDTRDLDFMAITTDEDGLRLVLPLVDPDLKTRVTFERLDG